MTSTNSTPDTLITQGMYSYVRHPHYLSNMLFCAGVSLVIVSLLDLSFPWLLLPLLPTLVGIPFFILGAIEEEQQLTKKFGEAYKAYKEEVPMFIPRFHRHRRENAQ